MTADHVTHVPGDGEVVVQAEERTAFGTTAIAMRRKYKGIKNTSIKKWYLLL
jgi:hypothetical protein